MNNSNLTEEQASQKYQSLVDKVVAGFAWQTVTKVVAQTFAWASTIIVARILDPSDYGLVAIVGIFNGFLSVVVDLGLAQGLIQQNSVSRRQRDGIFYFSLLLGVSAFTLLWLAAPAIARFYELESLTSLLRVAGIGLILGSLKTVPFAMVMREMNFRYRSIVEMSANFLAMIVVLVMAILGYGVWSLIFSYLAMRVVTTACYLPMLQHIPSLRFSISEIFYASGFGLKVTVNNLLNFLHTEADVFVISKLLGAKILGTYSMALQLARLPIDKIGSIFSQVAFPAVSRISEDTPAVRRLFLDLHRNLLIIAFPVLVGLALVAEDLVILLLTEKWRLVIPILQVFCVLNLLRVSAVLVSPVLYGRGRPGLMMVYLLIAVVVIPIAILIGAQHGLTGILAAWCIVYPCLYLLLMKFCIRNLDLPINEFLRTFVPAISASSIMAVAVFSSQLMMAGQSDVLRLAISISAGAVSYGMAFFFLFRNDARSFRNGISRLLSRDT